MNPSERRLSDGPAMERFIAAMARRLADARRGGVPLQLVGIRTRGVPLAHRLARELTPLLDLEVPVGAVDITLYRDDLGQAERWPVLRGTEIPFDVDGADVVLVDDVLFTGRTCRAAMDAITSFGRPARIQLAVLLDRGHRELPIRPDYVGKNLPTSGAELVKVRLREIDAESDSVWLEKP